MNSTSSINVETLHLRLDASFLIICVAILPLTGCAGQKLTKSGFIPTETYSQMTYTKDQPDDLIYVNPKLNAVLYHSVMVDPVVWDPVPKAPKLNLKTEARMTAAFQEELSKAMSRDFQVIPPDKCGTCTDVLRVRAAITNVRRSKWYYNALPVVAGLAAGAAGGGIPPIPPPFPGGASEEIVVSDASTGEPLLALATYNNGMPWNMVGQWLPYAHARRAFHIASLLLEKQIKDEIGKKGQRKQLHQQQTDKSQK